MTTLPPPSAARRLLRLPRTLLLLPVRAYQVGVSPYTPPACRYYPVCSQYAVDALHVHGALKGTLLAAARILRCNPLSRGGTDPVPAPGMWRNPRRWRAPRA
ncbi:membrane protein insertion efficiency factor YidD [Brachybacterium hainanense]|uniref:Putative membrane protein insertion efficiency factor n=1 Tax=Brachybacterium hainanense TaxID=1541174 RepID=A0ABV6RD90_9MICO